MTDVYLVSTASGKALAAFSSLHNAKRSIRLSYSTVQGVEFVSTHYHGGESMLVSAPDREAELLHITYSSTDSELVRGMFVYQGVEHL